MLRDRRHEWAGEDPDDWEAIFEDVHRSLRKTLLAIKRDAAEQGIDIVNLEKIKEPPSPSRFALWRKLRKWHLEVSRLCEAADEDEELWLFTEDGADLLWYMGTLHAKVYRQLCNRWHIRQRDGYGDFDYEYTQYVLAECLRILKRSFSELIKIESPQKWGLMVALGELATLEGQITKI